MQEQAMLQFQQSLRLAFGYTEHQFQVTEQENPTEEEEEDFNLFITII
jgi:hypothetical protein